MHHYFKTKKSLLRMGTFFFGNILFIVLFIDWRLYVKVSVLAAKTKNKDI
jgi:hypothetical protein